MDNEKGNLELLFKKIPYSKITVDSINKKETHDYRTVNQRLYMQYSQSVFPHNSEDERQNNYLLLLQSLKDNKKKEANIFWMLVKIAQRLLMFDGEEIKCKFDEMLRWREISFPLGQDFFTCAFLAAYDLQRGRESEFFAWLPIIRSDNDRLHNILKRGMAENHFHMAGSTKVFELNWLCLMNLIDNRLHDFKKIDKALQQHEQDWVVADEKEESLYALCQRAALYRVYLFAVLEKDEYLQEKAESINEKLEAGYLIEEITAQIQDAITLTKNKYGAKLDKTNILDYALQKDMIDKNNNECRLLAGERRFLYRCYKASLVEEFTPVQINLFYRYLSIRTAFRGELIQINKVVGFANFKSYQDRKEFFIEGENAYEAELVKLAVNEAIKKDEIVSLEARLCPKKTSAKLKKALSNVEAVVKQTAKEELESKLIYVLHFPKSPDGKFVLGAPRNADVRKRTLRQTKSIAALLEKTYSVNNRIRGIDACTNEIGCRPEVFAQNFRYLSELTFNRVSESTETRLHMTYHAGEDFLDIIDGIRAIDETILFCNLKRGSRIGHALAMGIDPYQYYKYKGFWLNIPKQILLDDIAWMLGKADETGCEIESGLRRKLETKFESLYQEIYGKNVMNGFRASIWDYYQSWKLRGDNPALYRMEEKAFLKALGQTPLSRFDRYRFNEAVDDNIRLIPEYRELYWAYHYNEKVRDAGNKIEMYKIDRCYVDAVYQLQDCMIKQLVCQGIGIETNPSSNYLIGTIQKYDEHPILRFNSRKLGNVKPNMSLQVSINTDDQGVFDTLLENEYALMTLALKKAKNGDNQQLYDIEDIYEWIDYVRKMGIEQIFR